MTVRAKQRAVTVGIGLLLATVACDPDTTVEQPASTPPTPVMTAGLTRGVIREIREYTGDVKAWREARIAPEIAGKIASIRVSEGDRVAQGDTLAELDTEAAQLQYEQAAAAVSVARATHRDASRNWERMKELEQRETLAPQQYEKATLARESAHAQLTQAEAGLGLAQYALDASVMEALFSGVVTGKYRNEGEMISPAMVSGLVHVMEISTVKVSIQVTEKDITQVHKGQRALLIVDALADTVMAGAVHMVNAAADPQSHSFLVQVAVPNPAGVLKPGMFGRVTLVLAEHEDALLVPVEAIVTRDGTTCVFAVVNGVARRLEVRLGIVSDGQAEVLEGLQGGERIVTVGHADLQDGASIVLTSGDA